MKCSCGFDLPVGGARFCSKCGAQVKWFPVVKKEKTKQLKLEVINEVGEMILQWWELKEKKAEDDFSEEEKEKWR